MPDLSLPPSVTARTSALNTLVFGVDVQSGDIRGEAPSYALVRFDGEDLTRDTVSHRKLRRLIDAAEPDLIATDNAYELAEDTSALVAFLRSLPAGTRLVQVTGAERPEPLSRVASRHGVPYGKDPMREAEAAARLAARNVGQEVTAFTNTTEIKVSRGRSTGKGGFSEDRYTRRIHGAVKRRAREVESELDGAGLEYDRDVTEKYGGFSNAVFTVEARPEDIPVSRERSGDTRVEVERERRDGIEYHPLAKRRDRIVVGIDPGTTTAVALLDLHDDVLDLLSTRTADTAEITEWIIERGRPVVVAADVTPMPETVEKIRRSFDAAGWVPDSDLPVDEKKHRARENGYDNDHERDALAAALFARDSFESQFDRIRSKVPPQVDAGEVIARVVAGGEALPAVLADLDPEEDDPEEDDSEHEPRELTPEEQEIKDLKRQVERLESHVEDLEERLAEKDEQIEAYEAAFEEERSRERKEIHRRSEVAELERENERLTRRLEKATRREERLESKLDRLKELWKLDHDDFADIEEAKRGLLPLKPVEQFTVDAIERAEADYGLAAGDVILLRDASGAGRRTAERLVAVEPRAVLKHGGLSEVADEILFETGVPVCPADDVAIEEVDELAVAREGDVEAAIADWEAEARERRRQQNAEMVDSLISEHRAQRRGASPSELLDSD
jgi:predicted RNase H-like nuclease (RuvC/YqgF family)